MTTREINNTVRFVIILLLIGVMVGLIFLYYQIDVKDEALAEDNNIHVENAEKPNDIPPNLPDEEVKPIEKNIPRQAENGVISIGKNASAQLVLRLATGYLIIGTAKDEEGDFNTNGNNSLILAKVEGDTLAMAESINEGEDVTVVGAEVMPCGIIIMTKSKDNAYIYRYDFEMNELFRKVEKGVDDAKLLYLDKLIISLSRGENHSIIRYDDKFSEEATVEIENKAKLIGVYKSENGYQCIFANGDAYLVDNALISKQSLNISIIRLQPIIIDKRICYAIISKDGDKNLLEIYSRDLMKMSVYNTAGDSIVFTDRLYTYNSVTGDTEMYCKCGEYIDIKPKMMKNITYIDYENEKIAYIGGDSLHYVADFRMENIVKTEHEITYMDEEIIVENGENIRCKLNK